MVIPNKNISEFERERELSLRERVLLSMDDDTDKVPDIVIPTGEVYWFDKQMQKVYKEIISPEESC